MRSLAIHSHKGGVGKTTLSVNIALELARSHRVVLLDLDLAGPSLQTFFVPSDVTYINKFLKQEVELSQCINNFSHPEVDGELFYLLANPSTSSIQEMMRLDKKTATLLLRQLLSLKKEMINEYKIDYLIVDTAPGINILAGNAFILTDNILFVNRLSNADIQGSAEMINGIMEYLDNDAFMVANQIPPKEIATEEDRCNLMSLIDKTLLKKLGKDAIQLIGVLPLDLDLQEREYLAATDAMQGKVSQIPGRTNRFIYALDDRDGEFIQQLQVIIGRIFSD